MLLGRQPGDVRLCLPHELEHLHWPQPEKVVVGEPLGPDCRLLLGLGLGLALGLLLLLLQSIRNDLSRAWTAAQDGSGQIILARMQRVTGGGRVKLVMLGLVEPSQNLYTELWIIESEEKVYFDGGSRKLEKPGVDNRGRCIL